MNFWSGEMAICRKRKARQLFEDRLAITYLGDVAGVTDTLVVVDTLIVVPKFDNLVIS